MNRAIFIFGVFFCLFFIFSTSTWGVNIDYHMMTLDPKIGTCCSLPEPTYTFYNYHEAAYCWVSYQGSTIADEIRAEWYDPSGDLYYRVINTNSYESGCWYPHLYISGTEVQHMPGVWRVDIYFDDYLSVSEYFTIMGLTTTPGPISLCPIQTIYGTDSTETQLLRSMRDNILSKTHEGRELIKLYYQWSPVIVKAMEADEEFKEDVKVIVDEIVGMVE